MKVIVNADDFGKSNDVNTAVEEKMNAGVITSATIMANGDAVDQAIEYALIHPEASFGVHLVLDEGRSLTRSIALVENGFTTPGHEFIHSYPFAAKYTPEAVNAIRDEWRAQIKRLVDAGVPVSHIDSHHHVHTIPALLPAVISLAGEFHIRKIRLANYFTPRMVLMGYRPLHYRYFLIQFLYALVRMPRLVRKRRWNVKVSRLFSCPDFFLSATVFIDNVNYFKQQHPNATVEVMSHPGHLRYQHELDCLSEFDFENLDKITYNDQDSACRMV